jgi:hypothetical protein
LVKFRGQWVQMSAQEIQALGRESGSTTSNLSARAWQSSPSRSSMMLTPFPGTVDFARWEKAQEHEGASVNGTPLTRYWLIPIALRPKMFTSHPTMTSDEIRERTQHVWDTFYSVACIWKRSRCVSSIRARLAFLFVSKLYRQMYAGTGIATDSARQSRARFWARVLAKPCRRLFQAKPMPTLEIPARSRRPTRISTETDAALRVDDGAVSFHVLK